MKLFVISYDLKNPGRNYKGLFAKIEAYGTYAKPLESFWLIESNQSATQIVDTLKVEMDTNDRLFVIEAVPGTWACVGLPENIVEWLKPR
jgi:hypothetical protein